MDNIKMFEEFTEGKTIGNQKYGPVVCNDCGYRADGFDFQGIFRKKLKCPKCNSTRVSDVPRPNVEPAPQVRRRI